MKGHNVVTVNDGLVCRDCGEKWYFNPDIPKEQQEEEAFQRVQGECRRKK